MLPDIIPIEIKPMSIFTALIFIGLFFIIRGFNSKLIKLSDKDTALSKCMNEIKLILKEMGAYSRAHKETIIEMKDELKDIRKDIQRIPRA